MFNNNKKTAVDFDTIVGASTKIYGDIHFSGKLHIDGEITGDVVAEKDGSILTISEGGKIEGNVMVHRIIQNGEVIGDVYAINDIELAANARVRGNVFYNKIEMERGSEVNGNMIHGKPPELQYETTSAENIDTAAPIHSQELAATPVDNTIAAIPSVAAPTAVETLTTAAPPAAIPVETMSQVGRHIPPPKIKIS